MSDTDTPSAEALADKLAAHNRWRRGDDEPAPDPIELGKTIDAAAAALRSLASERDALLKRVSNYETRLSAIMPPDFKDWHETHKSEWPWVAANLIVSQRAEIHMDATTLDAMSASLAEVEAERDALRAALDAERERAAPLDNELQEVLDWARIERAPLRDQEIASIASVLAKYRATPPQQEPTA